MRSVPQAPERLLQQLLSLDELAIGIGERLTEYRAGATTPSLPALITLLQCSFRQSRFADKEVQFVRRWLRKSVTDIEAKGAEYCRLLRGR